MTAQIDPVGYQAPSNADLDALRAIADPLADDAVAGYFATVETTEHAQLFMGLVQHTKLPPEQQVPAIEAFFESAGRLPAWADQARIRRGQGFFNLWAAHHFSAMYLSSLPNAYAAAKGVQTLHMTARLQTDTQRRLNETAQFLMDISGPGAFEPGGVAIDRILHVRLMHAAVRWLIANDPGVTRVPDMSPPLEQTPNLTWSDSWGLPVNQEDLAGTLLTFTITVYDVFDRSGVEYTPDQADDHLYMWRVIGVLLGIQPDLTPQTVEQSRGLRDLIWQRQHAPSASGVEMMRALLDQASDHVPKFAFPVIPAAFRYFLSDRDADMIGVPPGNWTRYLMAPLAWITRLVSRGKRDNPVHAWISKRFGRWMLNAILEDMRSGDRPGFAIPDHLADQLG